MMACTPCRRCKGDITDDSWICFDGFYYHGTCFPSASAARDRDSAANIDRLTEQVARLQEQLTACEERAGIAEGRVTVLEGALNSAKCDLVNGEYESAWKILESVEICSICNKSFVVCVCTAEQKTQAWRHWYEDVATPEVVAALNIAAPDETPAPPCSNCGAPEDKAAFMSEHLSVIRQRDEANAGAAAMREALIEVQRLSDGEPFAKTPSDVYLRVKFTLQDVDAGRPFLERLRAAKERVAELERLRVSDDGYINILRSDRNREYEAHAATRAERDASRENTAQLYATAETLQRERDEARAALAKVEEENARLRRELDDARGVFLRYFPQHPERDQTVNALMATLVQMGAEFEEDRDFKQAVLGRAVAALTEAREGIAGIYRHIDEDREIKAMKACKPITDKIDAILADPTSAAAGESYAAEREVIEAAKAFCRSGVLHEEWVRMWNALDALAKVAARRGAPGVTKCWHCDKPAISEWSYCDDKSEWRPWCGSRECGAVGTNAYGSGVRPLAAVDARKVKP